MRAGRLVLIAGLLLAGLAPAQAAWMTYVARDVATGARLGLGARVDNDDAKPALAILCTPDGLTAMFDTGVTLTSDMALASLSASVTVAADDDAGDPFPVTAEDFIAGDARMLRLRFGHSDAMALAEYVLGGTQTIQVSYRVDAELLAFAIFSNDSATISIGAVLGECEGRGKIKTSG